MEVGKTAVECHQIKDYCSEKWGCRLTVVAHTREAVEEKLYITVGKRVERWNKSLEKILVWCRYQCWFQTGSSNTTFHLVDFPDRRSKLGWSCYCRLLLHGITETQVCHTRYGKRRQTGPRPSANNYYIMLEQGIYQSSTPITLRPPVIELGMCGTPSHRIGNLIDPAVQACGDILNFFLWVDFPTYAGRRLYCYNQPTDPLINTGWHVAMEEDITAAITSSQWLIWSLPTSLFSISSLLSFHVNQPDLNMVGKYSVIFQ